MSNQLPEWVHVGTILDNWDKPTRSRHIAWSSAVVLKISHQRTRALVLFIYNPRYCALTNKVVPTSVYEHGLFWAKVKELC
jgi:hypothetical protein